MNKKKDWRKIKEKCLRTIFPSNEAIAQMQHHMNVRISNYNYAARDNQDSEYAEAREGR